MAGSGANKYPREGRVGEKLVWLQKNHPNPAARVALGSTEGGPPPAPGKTSGSLSPATIDIKEQLKRKKGSISTVLSRPGTLYSSPLKRTLG